MDVKAWEAAGGEVTLGPEENPFRSLDPIMEVSGVMRYPLTVSGHLVGASETAANSNDNIIQPISRYIA